jgi:hypothetical protein
MGWMDGYAGGVIVWYGTYHYQRVEQAEGKSKAVEDHVFPAFGGPGVEKSSVGMTLVLEIRIRKRKKTAMLREP